mmetsp:Transcript_10001/g.21656  ORF Transcript_10001/g.21656 Transcript_10001/m.21656 type:complete len:96 (+) Transcript_10001:1505-1792(+)
MTMEMYVCQCRVRIWGNSVENGTMDAAKLLFVECVMSVELGCQARGVFNAWKASVLITALHGTKKATGFCPMILHRSLEKPFKNRASTNKNIYRR